MHTVSSVVPVQSFIAPRASVPRFGVKKSRDRIGTFAPHRHPYYELLFFSENGSPQRVASHRFSTRPGSLIFVAPMTSHEVLIEPDDHCYVVYFDLESLHPEMQEKAMPDVELLRRAPELMPFAFQDELQFSIPESQIGITESVFERMLNCTDRKNLCGDTIGRSLLTLLLAEVTERYRTELVGALQAQHVVGQTARYVEAVIGYIDRNLSRRVTLSEAARAVAVTPNYLATLLRRQTGNSFVELVTQRRIAMASDLLAYTSMRISQIADAVGFKDADYFSRRFTQVVGTPPTTFRARQTDVYLSP
ncbi:AraC family transcriptional regulator [Burkholderia sp. WAC0059]|uniref:AraC family transcriptional regulator n=1 Tax=Burkholderia sp. WAC0059 TaxID=2066022 RepID=UPI0015E067E3|nr:AraC family transcriptional regulator [Burkholderia sp. WAC0059]